MKVSTKDIPKKPKVKKKPPVNYSAPSMGPLLPQKVDNSEVIASVNNLAELIKSKKPADNSEINKNISSAAEKATENHSKLAIVLEEKMDAILKAVEKKTVRVDIKRDRSGLMESLTFKSIEENDTA